MDQTLALPGLWRRTHLPPRQPLAPIPRADLGHSCQSGQQDHGTPLATGRKPAAPAILVPRLHHPEPVRRASASVGRVPPPRRHRRGDALDRRPRDNTLAGHTLPKACGDRTALNRDSGPWRYIHGPGNAPRRLSLPLWDHQSAGEQERHESRGTGSPHPPDRRSHLGTAGIDQISHRPFDGAPLALALPAIRGTA